MKALKIVLGWIVALPVLGFVYAILEVGIKAGYHFVYLLIELVLS